MAGCVAVLWEHCGEPTTGWPALCIGNYSTANLEGKGFRINGVSSLTFYGDDDCQVTLYDDDNFLGEYHTYSKRSFPDGQCRGVWSDRTNSITVSHSGIIYMYKAYDACNLYVLSL